MTKNQKSVALEHLFLDPNNYRFIDNESYVPVDDAEVVKPEIQERTKRMLLGKGTEGVMDLMVSFKTNNYLYLEPIQVRAIGENAYLVLEGNRRVATLKELYARYKRNDDIGSLDSSIFNSIQVSVVDKEDLQSQLITMGLHHISGKKRWNPLNQCQLVEDLHKKYGMDTNAICQALGISKQFANKSLRILALIRAYKESDYGDQFRTDMFSFFEETLKSPDIRNWLGWTDVDMSCLNKRNMERLFSWFSKIEHTVDVEVALETEDRDSYSDIDYVDPIITKSADIRLLAEFITDEAALVRMENARSIEEGYQSSENIGKSRVGNAITAIDRDANLLTSNASYISARDEERIRLIRQRLAVLLTSKSASALGSSSLFYFSEKGEGFSSVAIPKYRGLSDVRLENLSRFNLFVGGNNSGKTMVLESIYALIQMNDLSKILEMERFRSKAPQGVSMQWIVDNMSSEYSVEGVYSGKKIISHTQKVDEDSMEIEKSGYVSSLKNVTNIEDDDTSYSINIQLYEDKDTKQYYNKLLHVCPAAFTSPYRADRERLVDAHRRVVEKGEMDGLVQFIRENFDNTIESIRLVDTDMGGRFVVNTTHDGVCLDLTKYGEGLIRVFEISLYIVASAHGCVCVDELDSGIHNKMLEPIIKYMVDLARKFDVQLFISTHSKELVDTIVGIVPTKELAAFSLNEQFKKGGVLKGAYGDEVSLLIESFNFDIR